MMKCSQLFYNHQEVIFIFNDRNIFLFMYTLFFFLSSLDLTF